MAIRIQDSAVVTDVGTGKVILSDGGTLKLIEAADLPGSGGGGSGLRKFTVPTFSQFPDYSVFTVSDAVVASSDAVRAFMLPAGDYTDMGVGIVPSSTTTVIDVRIATYVASGTTFQGGALIADLGRLQRTSGAAVAMLNTATAIGVRTEPFWVVIYNGASSGSAKTLDVRGMGTPIPSTSLRFSGTAMRGSATLTYPAGGAIPAVLPTLTIDFGAPTISVAYFLAHV